MRLWQEAEEKLPLTNQISGAWLYSMQTVITLRSIALYEEEFIPAWLDEKDF